MKKLILLLPFILTLVLPLTALAGGTYRAAITVTDISGTDRVGVPVVVPFNTDSVIALGYLAPDGLNSRLFEGTANKSFMIADTRIGFFMPALLANQERPYRFETGWTPRLTSFSVITGTGGRVTIPDNSPMELERDPFSVEFRGWLDPFTTPLLGSGPVILGTHTSVSLTPLRTNHTVELPHCTRNGSLLLMSFQTWNHVPGALPPWITWPAGWTGLATHGSRNNTVQVGFAFRIATGTEGNTTTVTTASASFSAHRVVRIENYVGVPQISPVGFSDVWPPNPDPPALTTTFNLTTGQHVLWFATYFMTTITVSPPPPTPPPGYVPVALSGTAIEGHHLELAVSSRRTEAAMEDPGAFTIATGGGPWIAWTIGVQGGFRRTVWQKWGSIEAHLVGESLHVDIYETTRPLTAAVPVGKYNVTIDSNTTVRRLLIDGVVRDSVTLIEDRIRSTRSDWEIRLPYLGYYRHTVKGVLRAWYQPNTIIRGTTLPDRAGGDQNGTITWGSNVGLTVRMGGLSSITTFLPAIPEDPRPPDVTPGLPTLPLFPNVTERRDLPWFDLVRPAAFGLGWHTNTLYAVLYLFLAIALGVGVMIATGSTLLGAVAVAGGLGVAAGTGTVGWWVLIVYAIFATSYLVAVRQM